MAEPAKAPPAPQEHPFPPPHLVTYPQQVYNGGPYPPPGPPGAYMPPLFAYPPPPDGSHPEAQHGVPPAPYMIGLPPGLVYAYPPHPQAQPFSPPPANSSAPPALSRPKRKQVKMACTNCANACKRCDESRPCERCVKYGITESCIDGQRKERKKGIKRGPYKRKVKGEADPANYNGEWPNGSPPSATTPAAVHPVTGYPEGGFYPVYYPPPGFMPPPHPHDGQPGPDGSPSHTNGQPPLMPYYIHPGSYPPFPHYPPIYPPGVATPQHAPAGASAPPPPTASSSSSSQTDQPAAQSEQPQTVNPSDTGRKSDDGASLVLAPERNGVEAAPAVGKKRTRTTKTGEPKAKKAKAGTAVNGHDTSAAATASTPPAASITPAAAPVPVAAGVEEKKNPNATGAVQDSPASAGATGPAEQQQSGTTDGTNANDKSA